MNRAFYHLGLAGPVVVGGGFAPVLRVGIGSKGRGEVGCRVPRAGSGVDGYAELAAGSEAKSRVDSKGDSKADSRANSMARTNSRANSRPRQRPSQNQLQRHMTSPAGLPYAVDFDFEFQN